MKGFTKVKFFDMEIYMEEGMGNPYMPSNFFPILFMKYIPYKLNKNE